MTDVSGPLRSTHIGRCVVNPIPPDGQATDIGPWCETCGGSGEGPKAVCRFDVNGDPFPVCPDCNGSGYAT